MSSNGFYGKITKNVWILNELEYTWEVQAMVKTELTQRQILEKDFSSKLRGYDPQEVDEFLDVIIRDYKAFDDQVSDLENQVSKLKDENQRLTQKTSKVFKRFEAIVQQNEILKNQLAEYEEKMRQGSSQAEGEDDSKTSEDQESKQDKSSPKAESSQSKLQESQDTKGKADSEGVTSDPQATKKVDLPPAEDQDTRVAKRKSPTMSPVLGGRRKGSQEDQGQKASRPSATIIDILKRLSNLERAVFGEENFKPKNGDQAE